jgi:hypothetical protein
VWRIFILSFFVYYLFCKLFFLFKWSNGWLESLGKKNKKIKKRRKLRGGFLLFLFVYYFFCKNFFLFKCINGWLEPLGERTSVFEEEYGIQGCVMAFSL